MAYVPQGLFIDWTVAELEAQELQLKALFQAGGREITAAGSGDVSVQKKRILAPEIEMAEIKFALKKKRGQEITRTSYRYV